MPIELPRGLPFSVDTWSPSSNNKRYHFLTHAHKDHCLGISLHSSFPIYSTALTKTLLLRQFPYLDDSLFVEMEVGESVVMDDPDGAFSVSAFDANHCPGAVMFLFEGSFGNILHTGDCRLTPDCLQNLPMKYISREGKIGGSCLDYLFLDCTFADCSLKLPSKHAAIRQVISCIWNHPNAPVVYLACDLLGQEEVLEEVTRTFGSKIYVDETKNAECFQTLRVTAPDVLSQDASSRFQACYLVSSVLFFPPSLLNYIYALLFLFDMQIFEGFPKLYERTQVKILEARAKFQPEPLFIRPSAQWYACNVEDSETGTQSKMKLSGAKTDEFGVWHVCYSMHSSKEELEWALQLLQPKWVISTTPPCRAMELDYVRKHCFSNKITDDDPVWKLLKINAEDSCSSQASAISDIAADIVAGSSMVGQKPISVNCSQSSPAKLSINNVRTWLESSPVSNRRPITLFGRARLGLEDNTVTPEEENVGPVDAGSSHIVTDKTVFSSSEGDDVSKMQFERSKGVASSGSNAPVLDSNPLNGVKRTVSDISWAVANKTVEELSSVGKDGVTELQSGKATNGGSMGSEHNNSSIMSLQNSDGAAEGSGGIVASSSFNSSLRKLYRSMNVPVPRPLPSLLELMGPKKRLKFSSMQKRGI
ncbi:hypothetical protein ACLOJK_016743 [Asimina triloba]